MDKLIVRSTEGRIMLGVTVFVAIMILVGWIAINEPARMESFKEQNLGRSIERGGELFAAFCSDCHGRDGTGTTNKAPGLNNPHLFGYSYFGAENDEIIRAQREINDLESLANPTQDQTDKIAELKLSLDGDGGDNIGLLAEREAKLKELAEPIQNKGYLPMLARLQAKLDAGEITPLEFSQQLGIDANRLTQVAWAGTVEGYIRTTLIHGRPGSNNIWPEPMVSWSQRGGGPLRDDQIDDIVNYVMNFDKGDNWTLADFKAVQQYALLHAKDTGTVDTGAATTENALGPGECTLPDVPNCVIGMGTVQEITAELPAGDAANGESLYTLNGCVGCHVGGTVGPDTAGTFARIQSDRLPDLPPEDSNWTVEEFIVASVLYPNYYVPSPYPADVMPQTFGTSLSIQDLADIIAYLKTQ